MAGSEIDTVLSDVQVAWKATCKDYGSRALNSERCLQAAFYFHLRKGLEKRKDNYIIFIEAMVKLPAMEEGKVGSTAVVSVLRRIAVDTLICREDGRILVAMELKYAPRSFPNEKGIRKDLLSLSEIRKYAERARRPDIEITRHRETSIGNSITLNITAESKVLLGIFCSDRYEKLREQDFWARYRPEEGPWRQRASKFPPRFGLCLGYAPEPGNEKNSAARAHFIGQFFEESLAD